MLDSTTRLDATLKAICPIDGVAIRTPTVVIQFDPTSTAVQQQAALTGQQSAIRAAQPMPAP